MWVFCKEGFFSAVAHRDKPEYMMVRARFGGDLERLCAKHGIKAEVTVTPEADYRYRMVFAKNVWAELMRREAEAIDYDNFKDAVHEGTVRDRAYMACWSALSRAQGTGEVHSCHTEQPRQ